MQQAGAMIPYSVLFNLVFLTQINYTQNDSEGQFTNVTEEEFTEMWRKRPRLRAG
jgi:hypothetical protein